MTPLSAFIVCAAIWGVLTMLCIEHDKQFWPEWTTDLMVILLVLGFGGMIWAVCAALPD